MMFLKEFDLIIAGAGPAGCAAAVTAGREGRRVLLIEQNDYPGGAATAQMVSVVLSTNGVDFPAIWFEWSAELKRHGGFTGLTESPNTLYPQFTWRRGMVDSEIVKHVWDGLLDEAGVRRLYGCTVIGAETAGREIRAVEYYHCGNRYRAEAPCFIDATGNGDLAHLAYCRSRLYRQELSLFYRRSLRENEKGNYGGGRMLQRRKNRLGCDPLNPRQCTEALIGMRREILAETTPADRLETAASLGVRASRVIEGRGCVSNEDAWSLKKHRLSVARCSWELDVHANDDGAVDEHLYHSVSALYTARLAKIADGDWFDIPPEALIAADVDNLLLAGRIVSADLWANGAMRIQQTCQATGEAAGMMALYYDRQFDLERAVGELDKLRSKYRI